MSPWGGFISPYISRLLSCSSRPQTPIFSLFILCSFQPGQPLIHRCTIIKTTSKHHQKLLAFCLRSDCFPKNTHENIVGVDEYASEVYRLPFSKTQHPPGGYRKDRDCSRLFPLSVAAPRLVCRALVLPVLLDGCGYAPQPFSARIDTRSL